MKRSTKTIPKRMAHSFYSEKCVPEPVKQSTAATNSKRLARMKAVQTAAFGRKWTKIDQRRATPNAMPRPASSMLTAYYLLNLFPRPAYCRRIDLSSLS